MHIQKREVTINAYLEKGEYKRVITCEVYITVDFSQSSLDVFVPEMARPTRGKAPAQDGYH